MHAEYISKEEYILYNIWTYVNKNDFPPQINPSPSTVLSRKIALKFNAPRCNQTI